MFRARLHPHLSTGNRQTLPGRNRSLLGMPLECLPVSYATESVSRPFDRLPGVGLITMWTSRPNRVRHSNKRCSEIPRNRPFRRAEIKYWQ